MRHSVAEEMFVYPEMEKHLPGGTEAVEHDKEEHDEIVQVMKQLEDAEASSAEFTTLVKKLQDLLRHHANDEESEQFPALRHISARHPRGGRHQGTGRQETGPDPTASVRAAFRTVPQDRRTGGRHGGPTARRTDRTQYLSVGTGRAHGSRFPSAPARYRNRLSLTISRRPSPRRSPIRPIASRHGSARRARR